MKKITLISDDELKMRNVVDILQSKAVRRGIDIKAFEFGAVEPAAGGTVRQVVTLRSGIPKEQSRELLAHIKALRLKVTTQYQDDQIRVSGKEQGRLAEGHLVAARDGVRAAAAVRELPLAAPSCEALRSSASAARKTWSIPR